MDAPDPQPCTDDCDGGAVVMTGPCTDHSDCGFRERCVFETGMCVDASTIGSCTDDSQCEPPMTICDVNSARCVEGCPGDPCLVGFVCNEGTGRCVDRAVCEADRLEPNDASNAASIPASTETNLRACETDADFFALAINAGDVATVTVDYDSNEGVVVLELVGETAPVTTGPGTTSFTFTPVADGTYTARVALESEAGQEPGAFYSLNIDVQWASCVDDMFEEDDTIADATAVGTGTQADINACESDDDYFTFTVAKDDEIIVDVGFSHAEGDIDVALLDPSGAVVAEGTSSTDDEQIMHTATADGDYAVRVYLVTDDGQRAGAIYSLAISSTAPPRCIPDAMEPNDSAMTAEPIVLDSIQTLTACPGNEDFFTFAAPADATLEIEANFPHAEGDLDLTLFDAAGTQLATAASTDDDETITHSTTSSATLVVRVQLSNDTGAVPGNSYAFGVRASGCSDSFEPNNSSAAASPVTFGQHPGLGICNGEEDFYSFDLAVGQGVDIDLFFAHAEGDIDIELLTDTGTQLTQSVSPDDDEIIRFSTQVGGTYVLRVYLYADTGSVPGNSYDMNLVLR